MKKLRLAWDTISQRNSSRILLFIIALALLLSACTPVPGAPQPPEQENQPNPVETRPSPVKTPEFVPGQPESKGGLEIPETPIIGEVPESVLEAVYADLTTQYGVSREKTELLRAEAVVWPDGSLGCPEPGMMYTMALVNGYWIQVRVIEEVYDYRATEKGAIKRCDPNTSIPGPPASIDPVK